MRVFVSGSAGFVGSAVVPILREAGHEVVGLVRHPKSSNDPGVRYVIGSVTESSAKELATLLEGCSAIVHLVGIIAEDRDHGQTFARVHVGGTRNLVEAAHQTNVALDRFVYVSAIGARLDSPSEYSRTKAEAEDIVRSSSIPWTIFRPSLIFGPGAEFLSQMEDLLRKPPLSPFAIPFVPVPGNGQNRFQPVYINDLSRCIAQSLTDTNAANQLYEIGGADEVTFDAIIRAIGTKIGIHKPLFHAPMPLMFAAAAVLESVLPHPPITTDQLQNLGLDNVCDNTAIKEAFHISPLSFEETLTLSYPTK